jgi:hypothetical protein
VSDQRPIRTARRKSQREERFGSDSFCLLCGYGCLESLTRVTQQWLEAKGFDRGQLARLLEKHHVAGEAHDPDLLVTLCLNCHREITEGLASEGISMRPENDHRKLIAPMLIASAVLFESLAKSYRKWATLLENQHEP